MFNSYEFTFNGESSSMYGLMIYDFDGKGQDDVSFGTKASIIETRTKRRIAPIHFGVDYHDKPLEFTLVFGSNRYMDRFELEDISLWLLGHQDYKWLSIDQPDLYRVQFRCLVTELTPLTLGWLPIAFEAKIRCDCPYAYSFPFEQQYVIRGETNILFRNEGSTLAYLKPTLTFIPTTGTTELSIINTNDKNREFSLSNLPSGDIIISIDNTNGIISATDYIQTFSSDPQNSAYNLYGGFNLNFFRLVHGDNNLIVSGDGILTISGRFLHNVAG